MMRPLIRTAFALVALAVAARAASPSVEQGFAHPPAEARPWVYWFWSDGNVTRRGITADLEAMKRVGIGGVVFMEVDQDVPKGPVRFLTPPWRELLTFAVGEATRLGLHFDLNNDGGWCGSGGPWIDGEHSMQKVVWTETHVTGPTYLTIPLPQAKAVAGFYRDIAVLAVPNDTARAPSRAIDHFAAKSGLGLASSPDDVPGEQSAGGIPQAKVLNLSAHVSAGRLVWDAPAGEWTILRMGHTSTGVTNHPAPAEGTGLEVDKLSRAALDRHFDGFAGSLIAGLSASSGAALDAVHIDSWEVGYQNWTGGFAKEFERRRGYDPVAWLPTFTGRVVDSEALSERFLWDVRRTISEMLNDNYAARMAERAHAAKRQFTLEGYRYGPFDCISYAGRADIPVGEFWMSRDPAALHPSVKTMASAAHGYGKPVVGAEAFTATDGLGSQKNALYSLKAIGDAAFCAGINQFIIHRYAMQPWGDDRKPGMTMGPWGVEYERTATWWEQTTPWHEYLARCQYLLRQGRFVADLCYLQSEEGFNNPATPADIKPAVPVGYDFDLCSDEVVRTRMLVANGRLRLLDGMSYRVLVLPSQRLMTPALLRQIRALVRAGAIVYGPPPGHSPSLAGYPQCDAEIKELVAELWADGNGDGRAGLEGTLGKGKVIWGCSLDELLRALDLQRDFAWRAENAAATVTVSATAEPAAPIHYIHRELPDRDVYFVANLGDAPVRIVGSFRGVGGAPQLWNAETGAMQPAVVFEKKGGRTQVPLALPARGSVFVVFPKQGDVAHNVTLIKKDGAVWAEAGKVASAATPAPAPALPTVKETFTIAAWVKPDADTTLTQEDLGGTAAYSVARNDLLFPPPVHEVIGRLDVAGAGVAVGRNGVAVLEHGDHHFAATLVYRAPISGWAHVAVVFDRGVPSLYVNGKLVRTGVKTAMTVYGGVGVKHGREVQPFQGEHSPLRQFDRALSALEIQRLMRDTPAVAGPQRAVAATPAIENTPLPSLILDQWPVVWATEAGRYEIERQGTVRRFASDSVPAPVRVDAPWTVHFPAGWGAPEHVTLPALISWTAHPDAGVRYFSGTARYETTVHVANNVAARRLWLDLGEVREIAEVTLNGRPLGTLWKPPFRIEVTGVVQAGENKLQVNVTNLWVNRLIGDEQLPADRDWTRVPKRGGFALKQYPDWFQRGERSPVGRVTFTTWKHYEKDAPLLRAGLLGPVTLRAAVRVAAAQP